MVLRPAVASPPGPNGVIVGLTNPDTSATVNVDESTTVPPKGERWGFPRPGGQSLSYWLQQVRCDELLDHRTTTELPQTADTVVIGSGVSISRTRTGPLRAGKGASLGARTHAYARSPALSWPSSTKISGRTRASWSLKRGISVLAPPAAMLAIVSPTSGVVSSNTRSSSARSKQ